LNPRPPGYEPGELPDCSTPRRGSECSTLVTIAQMWDWAIWTALIVTFLAGIAALVFLVVRILQARRDLKRTRRRSTRRLDNVAAKAEATAERLATAGDTAELEKSLGRLRVSLTRLAVLTNALDEAAEDTIDRVTAFLPRK
jgi:hypothetical protein